jgi:hypothetical protein
MKPEDIVTIVRLALQYGVPAVAAVITALGNKAITLEDIQKLGTTVKPPEAY